MRHAYAMSVGVISTPNAISLARKTTKKKEMKNKNKKEAQQQASSRLAQRSGGHVPTHA